MAGPFGDMMLVLPLMYVMNQIDFTNETNLLAVRVGYGIAQVLAALAWLYIYTQVTSKNDTRKIRVPASPQGFGAQSSETTEQTICEYDLSQVKKGFSQIGMGILIISFIHYKWQIVQPLFLQCVMTPMQLYKNPLFKIFVLGQKGDIEKRPFKEENPLSQFMPQENDQPAASEENNQVENSDTNAIEDSKDEDGKKSDQQAPTSPQSKNRKKKSRKDD